MIDEVARFLHVTPWDWLAVSFVILSFGVALFSLIIARRTLKSQRQTEHNTMPIMTSNIQEFLLREVIIKVFDGYMRLTALKYILENSNYTSYPSEEELQDLKISTESIYIDLFYNNPMNYRCVQGLLDMSQAYNRWIDVINSHLKDKNIPVDILKNNMEKLLTRNNMIANTWGMVMTIIYDYDIEKKRAILDEIMYQSKDDFANIDLKSSYYPKDNVYTNIYDDIEQKENLMTFMNTLTTVFVDEFRQIMIPKV